MYYVYADNVLIYEPGNSSRTIFQPRLTLELGKSGMFEFLITSHHVFYSRFRQLKTKIVVMDGSDEIFRGRVLTISKDFQNTKKISCEGELSYLVDSVQKTDKFKGKSHALFRQIVERHNNCVEDEKKFEVGLITVPNLDVLITGKSSEITDAETGKFNYDQIAINSVTNEWLNTYDYFENNLKDYEGGFLRVRRVDGVNYLDWLEDSGVDAPQHITFGVNLLDITEEVNPEEVFSVLIPLGDENLTIEKVNDGSVEIVDDERVEEFGRIVRTKKFDGVNKPATLLADAQHYFEQYGKTRRTITAKAIDLTVVDSTETKIHVGDHVVIDSAPHGLDESITCTRIEYDLAKPENTSFTFGQPKSDLTERYKKDKPKGGGGGGKGGGGGGKKAEEESEEELKKFFDAWINVDKEAASVSLGALYREFTNSKKVLEQQVGLDMSGVTGNVNLKSLKEKFDDTEKVVDAQTAQINLLQSETSASIEMLASKYTTIEGVEAGHFASISLRADELESALALKADKVTIDAISTTINDFTTWKAETNNRVSTAETNITTMSTRIDDANRTISATKVQIQNLATETEAQFNATAQYESELANNIASISAKADANESSIELKADKTTVNSKVTQINSDIIILNGKVDQLSASYASIDDLIARKIAADHSDVTWMRGKLLNVGTVWADSATIANQIWIGASKAATEAYVTEAIKDFATRAWVNAQGFLKAVDNKLSVQSLYVSGSAKIGTSDIATKQYVLDMIDTWVTGKYAPINHTHTVTWSDVQNKPTYYKPAAHKHAFTSDEKSIANGHTHTVKVGGVTYTTAGVSTNATHKFTIKGTTNNNSL